MEASLTDYDVEASTISPARLEGRSAIDRSTRCSLGWGVEAVSGEAGVDVASLPERPGCCGSPKALTEEEKKLVRGARQFSS